MNQRSTVLVAEDDKNHVFCIKYAFEQSGFDCSIQVVTDGDQAIAYLEGEGRYANRKTHPYPDLFLLDLKMPRVPGLKVLEWIREHPEHHALLVIVLTVSQEIRDVNQAYAMGAKSFLVKPVNMRDLTLLINEVKRMLPEFESKFVTSNSPPGWT